MAENFNIYFSILFPDQVDYDNNVISWKENYATNCPFEVLNYDPVDEDGVSRSIGEWIVSEESYNIFSPKEGDVGMDKFGEIHEFCKEWNPYDEFRSNKSNEIKIIFRDNKQFFMPQKGIILRNQNKIYQ